MKELDITEISTKPPKDFDKDEIKEKKIILIDEIDELQNVMYAQKKWSLLVVIQGQDASGKDGAIKNVFSTLNPQGITVKSFKVPSEEERSHDFLWRIHKNTPEKGMIQIFNRSHYEDVLITRVLGYVDDKTARKRFEYINSFEQCLTDQETIIIKFYLHISEEAQMKNFEDRMKDPKKMWKYSSKDLELLNEWPKFRKYYQEVFENCSPDIPWTIVPADKNWYKEYLIAKTVRDTLKNLNLNYPNIKS
jgi:PPK2 family polyphosphate:nucleotide phosphotransferase